MRKTKIGLVGIGKIARDQHWPVLKQHEGFELVATASRNASIEGVRAYKSLQDMLDAEPGIEAVSLCTPPGPREKDAAIAVDRGVHVLLEKPPAATLGAARQLMTRTSGAILVASWHSRHAPGVEAARHWLQGRKLTEGEIVWKEDIRAWHPGQDWILNVGGMGVFDPGINALSILTRLVDDPIAVEQATLGVPSNRQAPLFAELALATRSGASIMASFDFLQTGQQTWDMRLSTDSGVLLLKDGGARLIIDGVERPLAIGPNHEYRGVYDNFAACIRAGRGDYDLRSLEIVADAFMLGRRQPLPDFAF